jgi:tRNA (cmo5U34)-methyltransferase
MIRRSVPGYELVVPMTGLMAARHILARGPESQTSAASQPRQSSPPAATPRVYDLGCSLGATTAALLHQLAAAPVEVVAVDNAQPMIERARQLITDPRVHFRHADVRELALQPARVVLLNYVLQFVPPGDRLALLTRIRSSLGSGGLLIVSEKIRFDDPRVQAEYDAAHLDFKRANGYSELEISGKRSALENVMIIDSEPQHAARFKAAGFGSWNRWFQCLNWVSFLVHT